MQDEQTLILHQREKHFRCPECSKRLNTAKSLAVHNLNVVRAWGALPPPRPVCCPVLCLVLLERPPLQRGPS